MLSLCRYLPQYRQVDPELASFVGQALLWLADPGMRSNAQIFQDYWAVFECRGKRGGYFVEFGAVDGLELSNTLLLERRFGRSRLLAEPNPTNVIALRRSRTGQVSDACVRNARS
jgi:hypothetical protein